MPPTEPQMKQLIIAKVGDDDRQTLATVIDGLWLEFDAITFQSLRALYVRRAAIEVMQAAERRLVNTDRDLDRSVDLSDRFKHLTQMYEQVQTEIKRAEQAYSASRSGIAVGQISALTPIAQPYITEAQTAELERLRRGDAYLTRFYPDWRV